MRAAASGRAASIRLARLRWRRACAKSTGHLRCRAHKHSTRQHSPNFFTPSILGSDDRPFFDEPPAFLVAHLRAHA